MHIIETVFSAPFSGLRNLTLRLPSDQPLMAAIANVALHNTQLDYMLRMAIFTLRRGTLAQMQQHLYDTRLAGSSKLRRLVLEAAQASIGDSSDAFAKLQALMDRCEKATVDRNSVIHDPIFECDGAFEVHGADSARRPLPSISELDAMSIKIGNLAVELNDARVSGFIHFALRADSKN